MPEFLELLPPDEALTQLLAHIKPINQSEWLSTEEAANRINHQPILSPHSLPNFIRSTVDGYAVRADDTHGASDSLPAYLDFIGEIQMGKSSNLSLTPGQCALIHTGGMLPEGANAVVMVEYTQPSSLEEIEIFRAVADNENTIHIGEDIKEGQVVVFPGKKIRSAEIGGLSAFGINNILVRKKPKIGIISSGDEVVPPGKALKPGQVYDINTYTLQALIIKSGGTAVPYGIIPDSLEMLVKAAAEAMKNCDAVIFTAGSSASERDLTARAINSLGKPGVLVHGVSVRPGKPTILAACEDQENGIAKPIIGLPGNPVSALVIAGLFVKPIIRRLLGEIEPLVFPSIKAKISLNLASQAGREDWIPVQLKYIDSIWIAEPVFGKSNLIFTLAQADGLVRIPDDATGLNAETEVEVFPL